MQNQPTQPTQPTQPDRASLFEGGAEGGGSLHRFFAYCRCLRGNHTPSVAARQLPQGGSHTPSVAARQLPLRGSLFGVNLKS